MNHTSTTSSIPLYKIHTDRGSYAHIALDHQETFGRIFIASDFGNWSFYWGSCGCPFKEFLTELDIHYAAGKFGEDRWFDHDQTIANLKEQIREYTRDDELKTVLYEELEVLIQSSGHDEFTCNMWNSPAILRMCDHSPDLCHTISPGFRNFWDRLWTIFVQVLREEQSATKESEANTNSAQ